MRGRDESFGMAYPATLPWTSVAGTAYGYSRPWHVQPAQNRRNQYSSV